MELAVPSSGSAPESELPAKKQGTIRSAKTSAQISCAPNLTDLIQAIYSADTDKFQHLLQQSSPAQINGVDAEGRSMLHHAILSRNEGCAQMLLSTTKDLDLDHQDAEQNSPLLLASRYDQERVVRLLIQHKCDVNSRDDNANTALHIAAEQGSAAICGLLLEAGIEADVRNVSDETPIILAAIEGRDDVITRLILSECDVNARSDTGASPLLYTAIIGYVDTARLLLQAAANPNTCDTEGNTPLIMAAKYGHPDIVSLLLEYHCDASHLNSSRKSALHGAAENDQGEIVRVLLNRGVSPSVVDNMGKNALCIAAQQGHLSALEPLAKTRVGVNTSDVLSMTPLQWAVAGGFTQCVNELLREGADPNIPNVGNGNTPLLLAVDCGYLDIIRLLIHSSANVNAVNTLERAALHEAAEKNCVDSMELLLPAGAYVNMQTSKGDTPLIIASRRGHTKVVRFLLDVNCNVQKQNSNHNTALHEASLWGHSQIVKLLLSAGASLNIPDSDGDTPLILAATKGHLEVCNLLLERGCSATQANHLGRFALIEAAENGHASVVKLLIQHGVDINTTDFEQDSALTLAAAKGHDKVIEVLIQAGCDLTRVNKWGRNALHEACSMWTGPTDAVQLLLESGMNPDTEDGMLNTPLILATLSGREAIVNHLLKANCNVDKPGKSIGRLVKPIQIAVTKETFTIAQMLYLAGCNMNAVNVWINTSAGCMYIVPVKNKDLKEWLKIVTANPQPLKQTCRHTVRKALGYQPGGGISRLPLPTQMKQYLLLEDVEQLMLCSQPDLVLDTEDEDATETDTASLGQQ